MAVRVQVLDEKGLPVHCTVAAVRTSDQTILNLYDTDSEGVANIVEAGTWYPRPMVTPMYKARLRMIILNAQDSMNADYVVDVGGGGTHTALYGASGALAAAIASGVSKLIWVCASHTETVTSTAALTSLAGGQKITVASGGRGRGTITYSHNSAAHSVTTPSAGGNSRLRFERLRLTRGPGNTGAFIAATGGPGLPSLEFVGIDWGDTTGHWTVGIDVSGAGSATYGGVLFEDCFGVGLAAFCNTSSAGAAGGPFRVKGNTLTMTNGVVRSASTNFEVGSSYLIEDNTLTLSSYLLQRTYNFKLTVKGNNFDHTGAQDFIDIGTAASTDAVDASITGNNYEATAVGARFADISPAAGTCSNIAIMGNALNGPGSGTAINVGVASSGVTIDNGYRDWTTNVGGTGAAGTAGDHGLLGGLSDDDHSIYALLAGRTGGQTVKGGTAASENLTLESTAHATKGNIKVLDGLIIGNNLLLAPDTFLLGVVDNDEPKLQFATNDYLSFDRALDRFIFTIGAGVAAHLDGNGDFRVAGYLRVGSLSAPTNVTDGDVTGTRLHLGTDGSFSTGSILELLNTDTATGAGSRVLSGYSLKTNPAANSAAELRTLNFEFQPQASFNYTNTSGQKGLFVLYRRQAGTGTDTRFDAYHAGGSVVASGVLSEYNAFAVFDGNANAVLNRALYSPNKAYHVNYGGPTIWTPSATQVIDAAADVILADATSIAISNTTAGSITLTSAATIANGIHGQIIVIRNVGTQDVVVQDQGTLANSNLRLMTTTVTIGPRDTLWLQYDSTVGDWVQIVPIVTVI